MALLKCVKCSGKVSDHAKACPHCGCPVAVSAVLPLPVVAKGPPPQPQNSSSPSRPSTSPLPARQVPATHPVAVKRDPIVQASDRGETAINPPSILRSADSGFIGQLPPYLRSLMRSPMGPYVVVAACGLVVIVIIAVGLNLGGSSKPVNQKSPSNVAQSGGGNKAAADYAEAHRPRDGGSPASSPHVASEQPTPSIQTIPSRDSAKAYCDLGDDYRRKDDFDRAIASYSAAIRLDPAYAMAYYDRGGAYSHVSRMQEAATDFAEVERLRNGGSSTSPNDQQPNAQPTKAAWDQMQQVHIQRSLPSDNSKSLDEFARKIAQQYAQINTDYVDSELCDLIRDWIKLLGESSDLISNYARERSQIQQIAPAAEKAGAEIGSANKENPRGGEVGGAMLGAFLGVVIESGQLNELDRKYTPQAVSLENRRKQLLQRQATLGMKLSSKYGLPFKDRLAQ